jgi:KaiC/GvpD/RAD55 family RecA-like ATPase
MFSRATAPTEEEAVESRRREQAAQLANEEKRRANACEQEELLRWVKEAMAEAGRREQAAQVADEETRRAKAREREERARQAEERERERREEWRAEHGDLPMLDDDDDGPILESVVLLQKPMRIVVRRLGIAERGRPTILYGLPDVQKTFLVADLLVAIARREETVWGGIPIDIRGWCLLLAYENPLAMRDRLDRFCRARGLDSHDNVERLWFFPASTLLTADDAEEMLTRMCEGMAACVIDSLSAACGKRTEEYDRVMAMLARVTLRTGTTFFVIHHCVKYVDRVKDLLQRLEFIDGRTVDSALYVEKVGVDTVRIRVGKAANVPEDSVQPATVHLVGDLDQPLHFELVDGSEATADRDAPCADGSTQARHVDRIIDWLAAHGGSFAGSKGELCKAIGMNRTDFFQAFATIDAVRVRCDRTNRTGPNRTNRTGARIVLLPANNADRTNRTDTVPSTHRTVPRPLKGAGTGTVSTEGVTSGRASRKPRGGVRRRPQ